MELWERWNQCKNCYYECGLDEVIGLNEDESLFQEHQYECKLGENCNCDFKCLKFNEDE